MQKVKLYGIKKDSKRTEFVLEKTHEFIPFLKELIGKLTKDELGPFFFDEEYNRKTKDFARLACYTDNLFYEKYRDYEFQIFIGSKRLFLVIWSNIKYQKKIVREVIKLSRWYKKS